MIQLDDYDFYLPKEKIALKPIKPKDQARMLVIEQQKLAEAKIERLTHYLEAGDALVVNTTKVNKNYLSGYRQRKNNKAKITANLIGNNKSSNLLIKPANKIKTGDTLVFSNAKTHLQAEVMHKNHDGSFAVQFDCHCDSLQYKIEMIGEIPLPPYIIKQRDIEKNDQIDYQTIFAKNPGAAAAPTAGLHFTENLLDKCKNKNIAILPVCLHVGAATFMPLRGNSVTSQQKLHNESGSIEENVAEKFNDIKKKGAKIVAIGTTTLRLLETCADQNGYIKPFNASTDIFIKPGYRFKTVDMLLTNFHLPRSSLFLLVCAFGGSQNIKKAYQHAITHDYRFYSYGDACLIAKERTKESI